MQAGFVSKCAATVLLVIGLPQAVAKDVTGLPTLRADVSAILSTALAEAPSDFANVPSDAVENQRMRSVKPFGSSLEECWVGQASGNGRPRMLFCKTRPFAGSELAARRNDVTAAVEAQMMKAWKKKATTEAIIWTLDNDQVSVEVGDPDPTTKTRSLYVGFSTPTHVARADLGPAMERFFKAGLPAAATKFDGVPAHSDENGLYDDVNEYFGDALPRCQILMGTMECFSPDFVEPVEFLTDGAKAAITAALPSAFVADSCDLNVAKWPVCHWQAPGGVGISLIIQPSPNGKGLHFARISIYVR